jgi:signal transduction histidine kinase/CheY-like chemotaxis protein
VSASEAGGLPITSRYPSEASGLRDPQGLHRTSGGQMYVYGDGLVKFDGRTWKPFSLQRLRFISSFDLAEDGRMWVGTEGDFGWLDRSGPSSLVFHSLRGQADAKDEVRGVVSFAYATGSGAVFVSPDHVYRWDGYRLTAWSMPGTRMLNAFRINGEIYIDYRKEGLFRLTANGPSLVIPQKEIDQESGAAVLWIAAEPDRWVLGTGHGLLEYRNGHCRPFAPEASRILENGSLTRGARLPDGRYAFGTMRAGLVMVGHDGALERVLGESTGLGSNYARSLLCDDEGSLWLLNESDVVRVNLDPDTTLFDEHSGVPPKQIRAITRSDGDLLVTDGAVVRRLSRAETHFTKVPIDSTIGDLTRSPIGTLASGYRGMWTIGASGVRKYFETAAVVATAGTLRNGHLAVSTVPDGIFELDAHGEPSLLIDHLPVTVSSFGEDPAGRLWLGTDLGGVLLATPSSGGPRRASPVAGEFGLPPIRGTAYVRASEDGAIAIVADGHAWIKSAGADEFVPVADFPNRPVTAVSEFSGKTLWLVHGAAKEFSACVARVTLLPSGGARWEPHSIAGLEAIGDPVSLFAETDEEERPVLWVGGSRALLRHVVANGLFAPQPKAPSVLAYYIPAGETRRRPIAGVLPYSTSEIKFDFFVPEFVRREQIHLQTRIDGIDPSWSTSGSQTSRTLNAVRDGTYTFRIRAVAETGVVSEPTAFTFQIAAPWWRTPQAFAYGVVLLAFAFIVGHRVRVRALRHRAQQLEAKVRERTEELQRANAAKTQFVANISHDIRNPLNGIVGLTLALEDTPLDAQQRELTATLRECTTYLSSLVDDVLDFAQIEAGRVELRLSAFKVAELLNSVVTTLRAESHSRGAMLTIESDPDVPPMLKGDAGRIQQILVNYVSNALKYAGGHIRLAVTQVAGHPGEIEFSVIDHGAGIAEADQDALFAKFSRLDSARRSNVPGTGLGLASCRLLADLMGGSVGVVSSPGQGARFFLRLPLMVATEAVVPRDDIKLPQTSVLLVEDTDYNALAAKAVLSKVGLSCDRASTGAEALQLFAAKRHHVVLLDRNLPDMDGADVARQLREIETDGARAMILAVTAYCTAEDRRRCLEAGMDAFLGKPLTPDKLRAALLGASTDGVVSARLTAQVPLRALEEPAKIDTTLLEYLGDGTPAGAAAQKLRFLDELERAHQALLATNLPEFTAIADAAHRVLGQARMVSAAALVDCCVALETSARIGEAETIPERMAQVSRAVAALRAAMLDPTSPHPSP